MKNYENLVHVDMSKLANLIELGNDLNEDVLGQVINLHIETATEIVESLKTTWLTHNFLEMSKLAHKFKSNCGQVALDRLQAMATDLEVESQAQSVNLRNINSLLTLIYSENNLTTKLLTEQNDIQKRAA